MRAPVGLAVCGLAAGLVLAGCGAGQITQMSTMEAAVNGTSVIVNNIALRNVHLRAPQSGDFLEPGHNVELLLVAANGSPDTPDKLLGITSDIGTVAVTGDGTIPAN